MKKNILLAFLLIGIWIAAPLRAQEIHFSLYDQSPLTLNPALTGAYEGSFRLGGIYRDQYRGVLSNRFATPMFFIDAPILSVGNEKRDWLGIGIMAYQDKAGIAGLKTGSVMVSVALHHLMDAAGKTSISFGLQGGSLQRKVDLNNSEIKFGDEYQANQGVFALGSGLDSGRGMNGSAFDLNAGLLLKTQRSEILSYQAGFSIGHLLKPNLSVLSNGDNPLEWRWQGHAQMSYDFNPKFRFSPSLYYTNLSAANQFQLQAWGGYKIKEDQDLRLNFGLGYRWADAGEILLGADIKGLKIGLSYDLTLSDLQNAKTGGAFEIAVSYIARNYRQPEVKPVILCPQL